MDWTLFIDIAGTVIGLVYLWLEYRASIWLWLAGVIMPIVNGWLYYERGLYADFGMEVYYVLAAVYGFIVWRFKASKHAHEPQKSAENDSKDIRHTPPRVMAVILAIIAVIWLVIYWFLENHTPSTVPVLDSFTTAVGIVAMWALAHKYVEQWLLWFAVDLVCTGLYFYKGIPFHAMLYGFYTVMAIIGYRKWHQMALKQHVEVDNMSSYCETKSRK